MPAGAAGLADRDAPARGEWLCSAVCAQRKSLSQLHTREVAGSKPAAPIKNLRLAGRFCRPAARDLEPRAGARLPLDVVWPPDAPGHESLRCIAWHARGRRSEPSRADRPPTNRAAAASPGMQEPRGPIAPPRTSAPRPTRHCRLGAARVDRHELRPPPAGVDRRGRVHEPGDRGVVPPVQDAASPLEVGHERPRHRRAERIHRGEIPAPSAQLHRAGEVRATERTAQAHDPVDRVADRRVDGDADANTTDPGPDAAAIAVSRVATVSSASSQLIRSHAGSSAPFGAVRRSGCSTRSAWPTIAGAALPFTHNARPVGWAGSGSSAVKRPTTVTAVAPSRETLSAQNVGGRTCASLPSTVLCADRTADPPSAQHDFATATRGRSTVASSPASVTATTNPRSAGDRGIATSPRLANAPQHARKSPATSRVRRPSSVTRRAPAGSHRAHRARLQHIAAASLWTTDATTCDDARLLPWSRAWSRGQRPRWATPGSSNPRWWASSWRTVRRTCAMSSSGSWP